MIDGVSGTDFFALLLDDAPVPPPLADFSPGPLPTPSQLVPEAVADAVFNPLDRIRDTAALPTSPFRFGKRALERLTSSPDQSGFGASTGPHRRWQRL